MSKRKKRRLKPNPSKPTESAEELISSRFEVELERRKPTQSSEPQYVVGITRYLEKMRVEFWRSMLRSNPSKPSESEKQIRRALRRALRKRRK